MEFISFMEILGTVAFAVTGAITAIQKDLDYYGICFLALITAVGGGILRDLIIDRDIPVSIDHPVYIIISLVTALVVILFYKHIVKMKDFIICCDALGLAAFTAIGGAAAVQSGHEGLCVIITLALLTGTGGGIIRDICAAKVPIVFEKEIYAVASIIGALVYAASIAYVDNRVAMYISFAATFIIRMVSVKMDIHLGKVSK